MSQTIQSATTKELSIAEFNEFDAKLQEFKEKYIDVVYDLDDEDQEKQARSDRLAIGKVVSSLDSKHKELKAPLKAQTDLIDGERKRIKDDLLGVQEKIKSQIKAHEQKIAEHAEMLQDKVDDIRALTVFEGYVRPDSGQITKRLNQARTINVDESFEHRQADGTLAQVQVIKELEGLLEAQVKYEQEQHELERLRTEAVKREQAERDERIKQEATKQAEIAAQAVIDEAIRKQQEAEEATKKAEQDSILAAERAAQAERERIETERVKAEAEALRIKKAEEAKKAKQNHRAKIHGEAKKSFMDNGFSSAEANVIVSLIKDGKITNIEIRY